MLLLKASQADYDAERAVCRLQVRSGGRLNVFAPIYELAQAQKSAAAKKSAQHKKVRPRQRHLSRPQLRPLPLLSEIVAGYTI